MVPNLFLKSILITGIFAFNHVIPLEIVSFISFSHLITLHPKDRNPFENALFIGGRRVEENSNALSCLHFKGMSDVSIKRVRNYKCSLECKELHFHSHSIKP